MILRAAHHLTNSVRSNCRSGATQRAIGRRSSRAKAGAGDSGLVPVASRVGLAILRCHHPPQHRTDPRCPRADMGASHRKQFKRVCLKLPAPLAELKVAASQLDDEVQWKAPDACARTSHVAAVSARVLSYRLRP